MLRIVTSKSVGQAKKYYSEGLTREGYYAEGQEMAGEWGGKLAKLLGLSGSVRKGEFTMLCDNLNPATGDQLTPRFNDKRRVGYDMNFNCPKSVTLAHSIFHDERIFPAFKESVRLTMREVEQEAGTRVRTQGRDEDRITGNLGWAEFFHFTARPVDGIPDPHMHAHCFVFNATWDAVEERFKAAQLGEIVRKVNHYQAIFHAHLAEKLQELGYDIVPVKGAFEIAGVPRTLIEKFSRRADKIMSEAKRRGLTTAAERDGLAALTREKKAKEMSITDLEPHWQAKLTAEEKEAGRRLVGRSRRYNEADETLIRVKSSKRLGMGNPMPSEATIYQRNHEAMQFAIDHLFYQRSAVEEHELLTEAIKWGYGRASLEGTRRALKDFTFLRCEKNGREYLTTPEVLAEEKRIVERCKAGKDRCEPLNDEWVVRTWWLNSQQKAAVFHVLNSRDKITAIIGKAGVGKTTVLREIALGIEATGGKVLALAPTAVASRVVLREAGFADAETVDRFLNSPRAQVEAHGAVLFVDEGGLMSARQKDKFLELADSLDCRVVIVGDTAQHHSVERGDALRLLQKHGEISTITIDQIVRQKGTYKRLVEEIEKRQLVDAFNTLEEMGAISEIPDYEKRYKTVATDFVKTFASGKTAVLIAPTHAECKLVTEQVREALKEKGILKEGHEWTVLRNLSWSPAEKHDFHHYDAGQVVKVLDNMAGFKRGEHLEVVEIDGENVEVKRSNGEIKTLPLQQAEKFWVYEREKVEICEGELVRITCNGKNPDGHELNNGCSYVVKKFTKQGEMVLKNGWILPPDYGHLTYGYTDTSHSAQSKTVDRVFVSMSALVSSGAIDLEQLYVSLSRGKEGVHLYIDDLEELREKVARVRERQLASDLVAEPKIEIVREPEPELEMGMAMGMGM